MEIEMHNSHYIVGNYFVFDVPFCTILNNILKSFVLLTYSVSCTNYSILQLTAKPLSPA